MVLTPKIRQQWKNLQARVDKIKYFSRNSFVNKKKFVPLQHIKMVAGLSAKTQIKTKKT